MQKNSFFIVILLMATSAIFSQDQIKIQGQIRYRYEFNQRDINQKNNTTIFNLLRSRIAFEYNPAENVTAFFQIQDSRILGEEDDTMDKSAEGLDMHQAYLDINNPFELPLKIRLGRFKTTYGNERLIGAVDWHNVSRSFDGITLDFHSGISETSFFVYKIKEKLQNNDEGDINFFGVWSNFSLMKYLNSDLFALWRKEIGSDRLNEYTLGTNILADIGEFKTVLEFVFQTGRLDSLRKISASLIALNLSYRFSDNMLNPEIFGGIDFLSGDDDINDGTYKVFNTLFATNHKFYGISDFFLNIPVNTNGYGLTDMHFGLSLNVNDQINSIIHGHRFYSSKTYKLQNNTDANLFGDELDLIFNYRFRRNLIIQIGGGIFFPGEIFEATRGKNDNLFLYTSVLANL